MELIDWLFVLGLFAVALCIIVEPWLTNTLSRSILIFIVGYICFTGIMTISYHIAKAIIYGQKN